MENLERYIAIDDKCAWPNLTLMSDGSIVASIFGEPCHQLWEGSSECWVSRDGGKLWSFVSIPAPHEPGRCRGDLAAGVTHENAFVVLCAGRKFAAPRGQRLDRPLSAEEQGDQEPMVCRSEDDCQTWSRTLSMSPAPGGSSAIPFGDVVKLPHRRLGVGMYLYALPDAGDVDSHA